MQKGLLLIFTTLSIGSNNLFLSNSLDFQQQIKTITVNKFKISQLQSNNQELNEHIESREGELNKEVIIKNGQAVNIKSENLLIKFISVQEDSRCPKDVNCVWAGNGKIIINVSQSNDNKKEFELNTNLNPTSITYQGYEIKLEKLNPYPHSKSKIEKSDYEAIFIIRKTQEHR